ncbi:ABC transporter permease [Rhodomicrobium lacus]|uniref:ABC transporter permease n=1 Tax=Rhodomicrobium lacus TaxID=2498452 RepID=UPI000F8CE5F5|nr:ABC transporter permease [Rhodomicrobium lacus]
MTVDVAGEAAAYPAERIPGLSRERRGALFARFRSVALTAAGIGGLFLVWALGGWLVAINPNTTSFAGFGPIPALRSLGEMVSSGEVWGIAAPSLWRVGLGLVWATVLGVPLGILIGRSSVARQITNVPFQFLRMISPLSWMPVAILAFSTWEGAIVFLIAAAAIWPILFSTAAGVRRIDPSWFKVARNLGANSYHQLTAVILPAISQDILTGIRLALGVGWIVLVPAEYLGVKSGLGYAINDARDTLEYDRLAAIVLIVGLIGFTLDVLLQRLISRLSWLREDH